jgi:dipeptidyl aminopeptidase/acylaminoacyl peptidase
VVGVLPSDITQLRTPSTPTATGDPRDGGLVLVAVSTPDLDSDTNTSEIHRVTGSGSVRWTSGDHDSAPAISPDGTRVAFLRVADADGSGAVASPQVWVMPADGGEARPVTALPLGADVPTWSPDGRRIVTLTKVPEPGRYGTADADGRSPSAAAEAPRHITRLDFHNDGAGYTLDKRRQLVVIDVDTALDGTPVETALTDVAGSLGSPIWTPDGRSVLVTAPRDLGARESLLSDLYRVDPTSGAIDLAVQSDGTVEAAAFGPDGTIFYVGESAEGGPVAQPGGLYAARLSASPSGASAASGASGLEAGVVTATRLTDRGTVDIAQAPGAFVPLDGSVLVAVLNRGAVELRSVPWSGSAPAAPLPLGELPVVLDGDVVVRGLTATDDGAVIATVADPASMGEVLVLRESSAPYRSTDFGAGLRAAGLCRVEELVGSAPDGHEVHGWLVLPDGDGPHPVLRVVHGGPFAQQDRAVFDEAQVYASAGYAVVLGNPRGSAGYGLEHGRAVIGAMGTVDVDDVLALLDTALERPDLDATRVGIMGGSYGGFMTSWVAAHHGDRFAAAWSERAVNAWDSFAGSSDIGWFFADAYVGADPEEQRRRSPLTYADQVSIPFMVAHSEQDWRCPIEQGQRQFVALRRAGAQAELLVFPGEGHELSRSGRPRHRVQRFEHVLAWWARHLPVA